MRKKDFVCLFLGKDFFTVFLARFHKSFHIFMIPPNLTKMWVFFYNWHGIWLKDLSTTKNYTRLSLMFVIQKQGCFHFFCNNFSKCSKTKQKYYHPLSQYIQYQQNAESTHIHIYTWRKTCCPPLGLDINETEKKKVDESNKTRSRVVKTNGPCSNVAATAVCNAHFYLHQALQKPSEIHLL